MHAILALLVASVAASDWASPLSDSERTTAQNLVATFRAERLGLYNGVIWFCNDGTQQPPHLNGCAEHQGGAMYATFSPQAQRLFKLGIFGGTILTALTIDDLTTNNSYRARALVIEKYLERSLDGWIITRAKTFRGFRQDEDEAESSRRLLIELAGRREMLEGGRSMLIRLTRALPYGRGAEALADQIRGLAAVISDADSKFADLRFKIHSLPEPSDIARVESYAQQRSDALGDKARELAAAMHRYYDPALRLERLRAVKGWLTIKSVRDAIQALLEASASSNAANNGTPDSWVLLDKGAVLIDAAGTGLLPAAEPKAAERNLLRLHAIGIVEELWVGIAADLSKKAMSRQQAFAFMTKLVRAAYLAGHLSLRERDTALASIDVATHGDSGAYASGIRSLGRILQWARARLDFELGVPLARYEAVEPKSAFVIDDILRSGMMLPMAALYDRLAVDAERALGGGHHVFGISGDVEGVRGENPGLAVGPLRIARSPDDLRNVERNAIVLLYDLPPDLPRVAGILTVGAPGSLSHVALLARNLAIPLASVGSDVATALAPLAGQTVVAGVSTGRRVVLGPLAGLDAAQKEQLGANKSAGDAAKPTLLTIDASRLDLTTTRIHRLDEISEKDEGVRVGPKAGELGRLKRLFPTRVSDAAVIPFGAFVRHVDTSRNGEVTALAELKAAYARYAVGRSTADSGNAEAAMLTALARFREQIMKTPFPPDFELQVRQALQRMGSPGTFGVYVRSDTNVEDLKDFTGAGLNLTVFNRVAVRDILQAIREVWASPYSERAFHWRQELITNPEQVFPSVLLHRTVPSEISGVIVTTDLETSDTTALTVSAGEGVSAVVDGGSPETLVVSADGSVRLLASARSPTRKVIPKPPAQGDVVMACSGKDPLLSDRNLVELHGLVDEIRAKIPESGAGVPWDIEFGIVGGKAFLMQIRPLKVSRAASTIPILTKLDLDTRATTTPIVLGEALP